jgi:cytochrome c oxidase assembly factor CtaG
MVLYTYNPSIQEAETGGSGVQGQLGYIARPCLKKKQNNKWDFNRTLNFVCVCVCVCVCV